MNKVRILVLGDMGRSPRMKNHCLSFAENGWDVFFSGYNNSQLPNELISNSSIHVNPIWELSDCIKNNKKYKFILLIKIMLTSIYLFFHLLFNEWTHIIFIQNPPAVPTFLIVYIICKLRHMKVIVDWHNFGYTLVPGPDEKSNRLKRWYRRIEIKFLKRRLKPYSFCVSKAMKNELLIKYKINADVLYDMPLTITTSKNIENIHNLYKKLADEYNILKCESDDETIITKRSNTGDYEFKENRPAVIISSCSWTIDDDFDTLFKALDEYNRTKEEQHPNIICIITGKGPNKCYYERLVKDQNWEHVHVIMPWLDIEDYPIMLSSADLGISLHKSSSGFDLPMKIVDMFSVCLPVLALNYKCLHELVRDRQNGRLFQSAEALTSHLKDLLSNADELNGYRQNLIDISQPISSASTTETGDLLSPTTNSLFEPVFHSNCTEIYWKDHWDKVVLSVATDIAIEADKKFNKITKFE